MSLEANYGPTASGRLEQPSPKASTGSSTTPCRLPCRRCCHAQTTGARSSSSRPGASWRCSTSTCWSRRSQACPWRKSTISSAAPGRSLAMCRRDDVKNRRFWRGKSIWPTRREYSSHACFLPDCADLGPRDSLPAKADQKDGSIETQPVSRSS